MKSAGCNCAEQTVQELDRKATNACLQLQSADNSMTMLAQQSQHIQQQLQQRVAELISDLSTYKLKLLQAGEAQVAGHCT